MAEPHCPVCGYTAKDAALHLDHGLCKGKIPKSRAKLPQPLSEPEERFAIAWRVLGGPVFEREYRFCERMWRFDFAWPAVKIAVEIEGGVHDGARRGRHMRMGGFEKDCEKYNFAALDGKWRIIRLTQNMVQPLLLGKIALEIRRCYDQRERTRLGD